MDQSGSCVVVSALIHTWYNHTKNWYQTNIFGSNVVVNLSQVYLCYKTFFLSTLEKTIHAIAVDISNALVIITGTY